MRKTWALAGAAVVVAVAATASVVVVSSAPKTAPTQPEPPANLAKVQRGNLSAMVSVDGTLTYQARSDGSPYSVINQARGTYTRLPEGGDKISCGDVLYRVDDHPVLLLCGAVPAYRDLRIGDVGEDVRQLNHNLWKLGYNAAAGVDIDPDDNHFTSKTQNALRELRQDKGVPVTGELDVASELLVALTQAQANYNSAVAKLELTRAGSRPEDIAAALTQVDQAKTKVTQAQAVPQSPEVRAAQAQLDSARSKLHQVLAGGSAGDVAAAQAQLDAANAKVQALTNPRPEDVAAAQSQLASAREKLAQLQNPRPEDIRGAQAQLTTAQVKLQALNTPRPEDVAAAQAQIDQAKTRLAQLQDQPRTANPADVANAQLAVQTAQVTYDKALADTAQVGRPRSTLTQAASDAAIKQALIQLQTAQNNLTKIQSQGPTEYDVRLAQVAVNSAQATYDKLKNPSPSDVQAAQAAADQAQAALDKLRTPSPFDIQIAREAVTQAQASLDKLRNPSPADVAAAQQAVVSAQAGLDTLRNPSDYDVQQAQQAVNQAQANVDKLLNNNTYDLQNAQTALNQAQANLAKVQNSTTPQGLAIAQAAVDQANALLKQAQANLDAAMLIPPFVVFLPGSVRIAQVTGELGGPAQPGERVLYATSDTPEVQVNLEPSQQGQVKEGDRVQVTLPGRRVAPGMVARIGRVAQVPTGQNGRPGTATIPAYISLDEPATASGLDKAPVQVGITTRAVENALSVPVTALVGRSGGGFAVEVVRAGGARELVTVKPGLFDTTGGRVQVEGEVGEGDQVVVPSL